MRIGENISLIDIKRNVIKQLSQRFEDHTFYAEEIPKGFRRPSFFVYLVPLETIHENNLFMSKAVMVKIDYYPKNRTNEEKWLIADQLERTFHNDFRVKDRHLTVSRTSSEDVDGILTFTLNLEYENGVQVITKENDDGETLWTVKNEKLGYTEDELDLPRELEIEEEVK